MRERGAKELSLHAQQQGELLLGATHKEEKDAGQGEEEGEGKEETEGASGKAKDAGRVRPELPRPHFTPDELKAVEEQFYRYVATEKDPRIPAHHVSAVLRAFDLSLSWEQEQVVLKEMGVTKRELPATRAGEGNEEGQGVEERELVEYEEVLGLLLKLKV